MTGRGEDVLEASSRSGGVCFFQPIFSLLSIVRVLRWLHTTATHGSPVVLFYPSSSLPCRHGVEGSTAWRGFVDVVTKVFGAKVLVGHLSHWLSFWLMWMCGAIVAAGPPCRLL